ncbi:MAG: RidA family protein [Gammaproteobacteria bacterium]|nr:RidA family protein [Gammaproteobacteria bacterium]MDH5344835.1 RidA family protein [Gammaproteobacteria bacterium]MDH5622811.1 RidA family protein [Gammaproteobacteria bacterium]
MKKIALFGLFVLGSAIANADVTRHPLPGGSTFPIAQAVEVSAGTTLVYHSGTLPGPANPDAAEGSREYWGDTEAQANSVFERMQVSLENLGLGFGDVVKMTVFLVGDPELDGRMDFAGFMRSYSKHFGTEAQPNKPARSAIQIAALARPNVFVEVEVVLARP